MRDPHVHHVVGKPHVFYDFVNHFVYLEALLVWNDFLRLILKYVSLFLGYYDWRKNVCKQDFSLNLYRTRLPVARILTAFKFLQNI